MIIVKILGGMGNQMFQYAMARSLSISTKQELKIDTRSLRAHGERIFSFPDFQLEVSEAGFSDYSKLGYGLLAYPLIRSKIHPAYYLEKDFAYNAKIMQSHQNYYLDGYFQSEKYFLSIEDVIRKDFTFKPSLSQNEKKYHDLMADCDAISLHIRRGDYITSSASQALIGSLPISYYQQAITELAKGLSRPNFFLFSDDLNWVKDNLKFDFPKVFVDGNSGQDNWRDMRLMSHCQHHIIANSSFSWWGAWLNPNSNKKVFAPDPWFQSRKLNEKDLIPESWTRLKV